MKDIYKKWWFWLLIAVLLIGSYISYELTKVPDSFEVTTKLSLVGTITSHYQKKNNKYYKKDTYSSNLPFGIQDIVANKPPEEIEISKEQYQAAYRKYSLI